MREEVQALADTLIKGIVLDEGCAYKLTSAASSLAAAGATSMADAMRTQARLHQVKALELRGKLAALADEYGARFPDAFRADP
ncbi:hypothetical protein U8607_24680 [Methylobacterium durans]|uniref:hypothetical protein n=1 Tax=Methylobacterium durans TaxID=2202825 RepID=UPI002AFF90F3|nr:hypothetical protein [Methylobacterium durans]MEA1835272.1 hypothetical protein [Methylobacterium durans]